MNDENITENNSAAEPRFKVGDVAWTPTAMLENDNPVFIKSKILALFIYEQTGRAFFPDTRLLITIMVAFEGLRRCSPRKKNAELFIDSNLALMAKKIMESFKDLGESAGKESNEEEE